MAGEREKGALIKIFFQPQGKRVFRVYAENANRYTVAIIANSARLLFLFFSLLYYTLNTGVTVTKQRGCKMSESL